MATRTTKVQSGNSCRATLWKRRRALPSPRHNGNNRIPAWRNTPELKFPKPAIIRGRPRNDFAAVDEFMAKRAKSRAA